MSLIRRILVAVKDPGAQRLPAVDKASQLARAFDAQVCLFHGITDPVYADAAMLAGKSLARLERDGSAVHRQRLERLAERLRRRGIKTTTAVEWDFPAHEAVIRAAAHFAADLIVTECHPTKHVAPWLLRFTDWELLRNSPRPVLVVKSRQDYRRLKVLAAIDPTHAFAKPANLDGEILRCAHSMASALGGALHAVFAYDPLPIDMTPTEQSTPDGVGAAQARAAARARATVDPEMRSMRITRTRRHVLDGTAADVIQDVAHQIDAQILVMGANSRSGLSRIFIGNTAERVLDHVVCDVLVVKPRQFRNRVARARRGPRVIVPTMGGV